MAFISQRTALFTVDTVKLSDLTLSYPCWYMRVSETLRRDFLHRMNVASQVRTLYIPLPASTGFEVRVTMLSIITTGQYSVPQIIDSCNANACMDLHDMHLLLQANKQISLGRYWHYWSHYFTLTFRFRQIS
jgi:hypothetical protein